VLLRGVLDDLPARGAERVEAYPKRGESLDELDLWNGPEELYRRAGFEVVVDGEPRALESGQVFTVEPGVYIPPDREGIDPRFSGIGVRVEDDVVVTSDGHENLTAAIPKDPDVLEALIAEGAAASDA